MQHKFKFIVLGLLLLGFVGGSAYFLYLLGQSQLSPSQSALVIPSGLNKQSLAIQLGRQIKAGEFPEEAEIEVDGIKHHSIIEYGINRASQAKMQKLFNTYRPDYGAFVALDARTGRILTLISFTRDKLDLENLALRATFPAASVFKVVTASAAIDGKKATPETIVPFNGANHTLYKHNVEDTRETRWTRHMTMREAFARSVNVVFSKLGLFYVGAGDLLEYAKRFGFNRAITTDVPMQTGAVKFEPEDAWSVATAASGFTRDNTMSPLQGALIAAAVANDGIMMEPYLVERIVAESGKPLYLAAPKQTAITFEAQTAASIRALMRETVKSGTSRRAFRVALRRKIFGDVEFGGKTGSLTGIDPAGKCDWFVGYARYKGERIAVAALTVNQSVWRVKSSTLASEFLSDYIENAVIREELAFNYPDK